MQIRTFTGLLRGLLTPTLLAIALIALVGGFAFRNKIHSPIPGIIPSAYAQSVNAPPADSAPRFPIATHGHFTHTTKRYDADITFICVITIYGTPTDRLITILGSHGETAETATTGVRVMRHVREGVVERLTDYAIWGETYSPPHGRLPDPNLTAAHTCYEGVLERAQDFELERLAPRPR